MAVEFISTVTNAETEINMRLTHRTFERDDESQYYVDRDDVRSEVAKRIIWNPDEPSRVAMFHGAPGIGKTAASKIAVKDVILPIGAPYVIVDYQPDDADLRSCERTFGFVRQELKGYSLLIFQRLTSCGPYTGSAPRTRKYHLKTFLQS